MRPRAFLFGVAFALTQALSFAWAQQVDKVPSVGVLSNSPLTSSHFQAFRQGLRDLGYIEGKNIAIVPKSAEGNPDRFPDLAREFVRLNVNVLLVPGDQGLRAAKEATDAIPIIVLACDPLRQSRREHSRKRVAQGQNDAIDPTPTLAVALRQWD
jgi:putative ABC transport system substrate-binding protein